MQDLPILHFASLNPLFEQVFVIAVCPGSQCEDSFVGELATVGVDEHGYQTIMFAWQCVDQLHYLVNNLLQTHKNMDLTIMITYKF